MDMASKDYNGKIHPSPGISQVFQNSKQCRKTVYFVGIGGIGMSGVAEILHGSRFQVSGSDAVQSSNTGRLCQLGLPVHIGHDAANIVKDQVGALIITPAISLTENPEYFRALAIDLPIFTRAQVLGHIMTSYTSTITVSGTHGKTTTTSMVGSLLEAAAFHPTIVSGGIMHQFGSNVCLGSNEWIVAEGDDSDGSFKALPTSIAVVTNVEPEHMTYFETEENLEREFEEFLIKATRVRILCVDCPRVRKIHQKLPTNLYSITYGFHESADFRCIRANYTQIGSCFDVTVRSTGDTLTNLFLPLHGKHNVQNALVLVAISKELGIPETALRGALGKFQGVGRRFSISGTVNGITVVDDYAHHPTEIEATLKAARGICAGKLVAVHQPHRYSRLASLFNEFSACFKDADQVILLPVYTAGETDSYGVSSESLTSSINENGGQALYIGVFEKVYEYLCKLCQPADMIVFMGAGTITQLANEFPEVLKKHHSAMTTDAEFI